MDIQFVIDFVKNKKHSLNSDAIQARDNILVHTDGSYPKNLIDTARPNEPESISKYRKSIFKSPTKGVVNKIYELLQKIRKSEDWGILFPDFVGAVPEKEKIKNYLVNDFPEFDTLENYVFSVLLKFIITDANAVIVVLPTNFNIEQNEFFTPFPFVYGCDDVLSFSKELVVLKNGNDNGIEKFLFIDKETIFFVTVDLLNSNKIDYIEHKNSIGEIPAFIVGGNVKYTSVKYDNFLYLYESFIAPALDNFDEATRLYSDQQGNFLRHVNPEKFIYNSNDCKICNGSGKVKSGENYDILDTCKNCNGSGFSESPYGLHEINPKNISGFNVPTPPMGYLEKDTKGIELLKQEIEDHCRKGLSALGLEFLDKVPANQSGVAKEYDRQEIIDFVSKVANHLVDNVINPIIYYIMQWRYYLSLSKEQIKLNKPILVAPKKYDSITSSIASSRLQSAIKNNYGYSIISQLTLKYAQSEFGADSPQYKKIKATIELDALGGKTEDEKMAMLSSNGISLIDYVISCNLERFINKAINEINNFLDLPYGEQFSIIENYAKENINNQPKKVPLYG